MPESTRFSGESPYVVAGRYLVNERMVNDLRLVGGVAEERVHRIVATLNEADGFLDPEALRERLKSILPDRAQLLAVSRVLLFVEAQLKEPLISSVQEWNRRQGQIPDDELSVIEARLSDLIGRESYPALNRYRKAIKLSQAVGRELEGLEIICELRPVFDESRTTIEGMIPSIRMKLVVEEENGNSAAFEVQMNSQQVEDLLEKTQKALRKLSALEAHVKDTLPGGWPTLG